MKDFRNELELMYERLTSGKPFAFSKFADGEWMAMNSVTTSNGEWIMNDPNLTSLYERSRNWLWDAFRYKDPDYYVGVSCSCCQGKAHQEMVEASGQSQANLTFANIFVNANYELFLSKFIEFFRTTDRPIVLYANKSSDITKLPFPVQKFYPISYNAWVNSFDLGLIDHTLSCIDDGSIVLYSAGPYGNIAIKHHWEYGYKNSSHIDVGSTIDRWLNNDRYNKRCYAVGDQNYSKKVCVWG
jgi:hypothetical protein